MLKELADFMERQAFQKIYLTLLMVLAILFVRSGMMEEGKLLFASAVGALFMGMKPGGSQPPPQAITVTTPTTTTTATSGEAKP